MPGKRVQFDDETWLALDVLARDRMMSFQELADEAFRDLLEKHHRPTNLKSALKQSAGMHGPPTQSKRIKAGSELAENEPGPEPERPASRRTRQNSS
jgi:predicted DNA-binding ribbon-helix-helix protein